MAYLSAPSDHEDRMLQEELLQCFAAWKHRFDGSVRPELGKKPVFSASYENLWHDVFAEYDQLESIRTTNGLARQTWQDGVDEERRETEGLRKHISESTALSAHEWSVVPLGMVLEKYLGASVRSRDKDAAIALERWRKFCDVVVEQPHFLHYLSFTQRVSWSMLRDWWLGTHQEPSLSKVARASLEAAASSAVPMTYLFGEVYPDAEAFNQLRKSVYSSIMFNLFNREFNPYHWESHLKAILLATLRLTRFQAIQHATAQRLGYTSYVFLRGLQTNDSGTYRSSINKPCPWLRSEGKSKELPFFLWDVEQMRTVTMTELNTEPEEYCCVSHTWGRWRKEAIPIKGVPWLVPQNTKFDVERLPEHLKQFQPRVRFIWIDLFCIPQDRSQKADEEINRQALIFQNASHCIAWINDVRQWGGTIKAMDWLGISYLHATTAPGIYDTDKLLDSLHHEANSVSELLSLQTDPAEIKARHSAGLLVASGDTPTEPASWFSSLWTLQEAMLCPNITFVSRDWVPLNDRAGTPVPLDTFFNFVETVDSVWLNGMPYNIFTEGTIIGYTKYNSLLETDEHFQIADQYLKWPNGPRQLRDLCLVTRMAHLLETPSPTGILMVANVRQCTDSRAPAIMSALGVTEWYKSNPTEKASNDLVLNTYPLAFVKEAASKLGASFYESVTIQQETPEPHGLFTNSQRGSIMPFSATNGWYSRIDAMPIHHRSDPQDHPAVQMWTIQQNGSVEIKQAGIVASTETSNPQDESPMMLDIRKPEVKIFECPFGDWAKGLPNGTCAYAVSLLQDSQMQHGLILRGPRKVLFSTQRLVKVGTFILPKSVLPPTTTVDWIVW
ncbi:MAG: hypothetical protein Q9161_009733 [Pseudevernia consocians]